MFSMTIPNAKKRIQSISRLQTLVSFAALAMLLSSISAYGMDPETKDPETTITMFQVILKKVQKEDGEALCMLGHYYQYGKTYCDYGLRSSAIPTVNRGIANHYYERAVAAGYRTAATELAVYYLRCGNSELFAYWNSKKFEDK